MIRIPTRRLILRPFTDRDLPTLRAYRNDPVVALYQGWGPMSIDDSLAFLEEMTGPDAGVDGAWLQLAIEHRELAEHIGDCALRLIPSPPRQAQVGYTIARGFQRQGFATEAVGALVDTLFSTIGVHRIIAGVAAPNIPSIRLLEGLGFRREAHFRESTLVGGELCDEYLYAVLAREWQREGSGTDARLAAPTVPADMPDTLPADPLQGEKGTGGKEVGCRWRARPTSVARRQ